MLFETHLLVVLDDIMNFKYVVGFFIKITLILNVVDKCPDGFIGKYCDKQCSYPQYGIGCQQSCKCSKRRCNVFTGCQFTKTGI